LPNLVVPGVAAAIKRSRGKKVFVCNIMTQANETPGYTLADFLQILSLLFLVPPLSPPCEHRRQKVRDYPYKKRRV